MKSLPTLLLLLFLLLGNTLQAQDEEEGEPENPLIELQPLLEAWNGYINHADMEGIAALYAPKVKAYGRSLARNEMLQGKKTWLSSNAGYRQEISDFGVRTVVGGIELSFKKTTIQNGARKTFSAYLVFDSDTKLIVQESDLTTDANLAKKLKATALPQGLHCFNMTGGIWPEGAVPTFYELHYALTIKGSVVKGEGLYYSWFGRSMHSLEIKGSVQADNSLLLYVTAFGPMYPDEPNDKMEWKETRKWDGEALIWSGGDESSYPTLWQKDCQ